MSRRPAASQQRRKPVADDEDEKLIPRFITVPSALALKAEKKPAILANLAVACTRCGRWVAVEPQPTIPDVEPLLVNQKSVKLKDAAGVGRPRKTPSPTSSSPACYIPNPACFTCSWNYCVEGDEQFLRLLEPFAIIDVDALEAAPPREERDSYRSSLRKEIEERKKRLQQVPVFARCVLCQKWRRVRRPHPAANLSFCCSLSPFAETRSCAIPEDIVPRDAELLADERFRAMLAKRPRKVPLYMDPRKIRLARELLASQQLGMTSAVDESDLPPNPPTAPLAAVDEASESAGRKRDRPHFDSAFVSLRSNSRRCASGVKAEPLDDEGDELAMVAAARMAARAADMAASSGRPPQPKATIPEARPAAVVSVQREKPHTDARSKVPAVAESSSQSVRGEKQPPARTELPAVEVQKKVQRGASKTNGEVKPPAGNTITEVPKPAPPTPSRLGQPPPARDVSPVLRPAPKAKGRAKKQILQVIDVPVVTMTEAPAIQWVACDVCSKWRIIGSSTEADEAKHCKVWQCRMRRGKRTTCDDADEELLSPFEQDALFSQLRTAPE